MYTQGYDVNGTIPTMLSNIKMLTDADKGVVVTNKTIADNFDAKLSDTPKAFVDDTKYQQLFTGVSSAITGTDPSSNLFDVNNSITNGEANLSTALTTMFTNA
jgi:hypothetical protein